MTVRGMKITLLLRYPHHYNWHNSHRLPLHNSGALPPVHELFKLRSYLRYICAHCHCVLIKSQLSTTLTEISRGFPYVSPYESGDDTMKQATSASFQTLIYSTFTIIFPSDSTLYNL